MGGQHMKWIIRSAVLMVMGIVFALTYGSLTRFDQNEALYLNTKEDPYINIPMETKPYTFVLSSDEVNWKATQDQLVYVSDRNSPPMRYVDPKDSGYKGAVIDYVDALSAEIGIRIVKKPMVWNDALGAVAAGEADMCDMYRSEIRAKSYLFSNPIYIMRGVLAVKGNDGGISDLSNLNAQSIATVRGDYANEYLAATCPDVKIRRVSDIGEAMALLQSGAVDAVAGNEPSVLYCIRNYGENSGLRVLEETLYEKNVVLGISKSKPQLVGIINKGIASLNKKRELQQIQQKWFGISTPIARETYISKLIRAAQAGLMALVFGVPMLLIWNFTLRKQVEYSTTELIESRNELQTVFDGMDAYLVVVGPDGRIRNANESFCNAFGTTKPEVVGAHCETVLSSFCAACAVCLGHNDPESSSDNRREVEVGNEVYSVQTFPLKKESESDSNTLLAIHNITGDKISKNQILQENKMAAVGHLAAGIAHEIRNPLGIIRSHSYIIRSGSEKGSSIQKSLDFIDSAVDRASRIIDNLLNFSRITDPGRNKVRMQAFIHEIMELESKQLQRRNIRWTVECDPSVICEISQESLKHIFINLISNAADAVEDNGVLSIHASKGASDLQLVFSDNGPGIAPEHIEKIFNPFFSTKEPGKGTGLGLYIVFNEVKKLGGDIRVESEPGEGTSFILTIPHNTGGAHE